MGRGILNGSTEGSEWMVELNLNFQVRRSSMSRHFRVPPGLLEDDVRTWD